MLQSKLGSLKPEQLDLKMKMWTDWKWSNTEEKYAVMLIKDRKKHIRKFFFVMPVPILNKLQASGFYFLI